MHDTDAIRRGHPIADVAAASGLELRQTGGRLAAVCPFHGDSRPSLVFYPASQSYYCFGCGAGGDVIDFVSRLHKVGFRDAATILTGEQQLPTCPQTLRTTAAPVPALSPEQVGAIIEAAVGFYHDALWSHPSTLSYLHDRGVSERTARVCRIGFGVPGLAAVLAQRGFDLGTAEGLGLLADERERFGGRVIIPDLIDGRATWFTGRRLSDREPRYLNLRLPKPLLGLASAKGEAVVVTEGPFDWLTAVEWGFWAVALLGTRVPGKVAQSLDRFEDVYLVLDPDEAGREATKELHGRLGRRAIPVALPPGVSDLSSLGRHPDGRSIFARCVLQASHVARAGRQQAA